MLATSQLEKMASDPYCRHGERGGDQQPEFDDGLNRVAPQHVFPPMTDNSAWSSNRPIACVTTRGGEDHHDPGLGADSRSNVTGSRAAQTSDTTPANNPVTTAAVETRVLRWSAIRGSWAVSMVPKPSRVNGASRFIAEMAVEIADISGGERPPLPPPRRRTPDRR